MNKSIIIMLSMFLLLFISGCNDPVSSINIINESKTVNITVNEVVNPVAQFHRVADLEADNVDTWYNITWDMVVPDETTNGYFTRIDSNHTILIDGFEGVVRVQGCIHPYNDGSSRLEKTLRVRTIIDGQEARCLQASTTKDRRVSDVDIIVYTGTIAVHNGSKVQVQWRTEDTNLILHGDNVFDNPVSASVNFEKISIFSD